MQIKLELDTGCWKVEIRNWELGTQLRIFQLPACRRHGELRVNRHKGAKEQRNRVTQKSDK